MTTTVWGHNGGESSASTDMYIDLNNNIGICVLTNGEGDALNICHKLYEYALTLNANNGIEPSCANANIPCSTTTSVIDNSNIDQPSIITSADGLSTQGMIEICISESQWQATKNITLNANFSVKLRSLFTAMIGDCE